MKIFQILVFIRNTMENIKKKKKKLFTAQKKIHAPFFETLHLSSSGAKTRTTNSIIDTKLKKKKINEKGKRMNKWEILELRNPLSKNQ